MLENLTNKIDYLWNAFSPGQLQVASNAADEIQGLQPPKKVTEIKSFIGLQNAHRRFILNFAKISSPLNEKIKMEIQSNLDRMMGEELNALNNFQEAWLLHQFSHYHREQDA